MKMMEEGFLLRIFIGEDDYYEGELLYNVLVKTARELEIAGATVLKGIEGYGANSRIHTSKVLRLSEDLPIIVEIIDSKEYIEKYLKEVDEIIEEGLITKEKVDVIAYRSDSGET